MAVGQRINDHEKQQTLQKSLGPNSTMASAKVTAARGSQGGNRLESHL